MVAYAGTLPAYATTRPAAAGLADGPGSPAQRVEGGRRGQLLVRHDPGQQGVQRGALQPRQRGHARRDHVQRPEHRLRQHRVDQQDQRQQPEPRLGRHDDPRPVHGVRQRPAVQPEDDQRDQLDRAHRPHGQRRPGQLLDLERQRDQRHGGAEEGDEALPPQQPEVTRGAPGREVGQDGRERRLHGRPPSRGRDGGMAVLHEVLGPKVPVHPRPATGRSSWSGCAQPERAT